MFFQMLGKLKQQFIHQLSRLQNTRKSSESPMNSLTFLIFFSLLLLSLEIAVDFPLDIPQTFPLAKVLVYSSVFIPYSCFLFFRFVKLRKLQKMEVFVFISFSFSLLSTFFFRLNLLKKTETATMNIDDIIMDSILVCLTFYPFYCFLIQMLKTIKQKCLLVLIQDFIFAVSLALIVKMNVQSAVRLVLGILFNSIVLLLFPFDSPKKKTPQPVISTISCVLQDWKSLVNELPNGVFLVSQDKNLLYTNKSVFELLDMDPEEFEKSVLERISEKIVKIEEIDTDRDDVSLNENGDKFESSSNLFSKSVRKKTVISGYNPVNIISHRQRNTFRKNFKNKSSTSSIQIINGSLNPEFFSIRKNSEEINASLKQNLDLNRRRESSILEKPKETSENKTSKSFHKVSKRQRKPLNLYSSYSNLSSLGLKVKQKTSALLQKPLENNKPKKVCDDLCFMDILNDMIAKPHILSKSYLFETEKKKHCEFTIKRIWFEGSQVFLATLDDVSYLKVMQELNEHNEYKNKVMTTLSHELRTPLNGALTPLESLIKERSLKPEEMYSLIEIAYKSVCLLQNVLNDVVDFALINSNQLYLNYEEGNIKEFLQETLELFSRQAEEKKIILELEVDSNSNIPIKLKTDFQRLRQIVVSLLSNALKNTFQGKIFLHLKMLDESIVKKNDDVVNTNYSLRIFMEDSGVGIEEKKLETIKKSLKSKDLLQVCAEINTKQGCGLGLIISHCLALLLGPVYSNGLEINSEVNKGTEVSFILEACHEKNEKDWDMLSVIEENKETSKYTFSANENPCYSKTFGTFLSGEIFDKKKRIQKLSLTSKKEEIDLPDKLLIKAPNSQMISSEREKINFLNFLTAHSFEVRTSDFMSSNKGSNSDGRFLTSLKKDLSKCSDFESLKKDISNPKGIFLSSEYPSLKKDSSSKNRIFLSSDSSSLKKDISSPIKRFNNSLDFTFSPNGKSQNLLDFPKLKKEISYREEIPDERPEILIADDDSFNLMALETILKKFNLRSVRAFNGEQVLQILRNKHQSFPEKIAFALVFLDYHMPVKDGLETTIEIKEMIQKEGLKKFPIIACTAFGARDLVERWEEAGISDFIVKPVSFQKLQNVLLKFDVILK